jgi:hypothetical protein
MTSDKDLGKIKVSLGGWDRLGFVSSAIDPKEPKSGKDVIGTASFLTHNVLVRKYSAMNDMQRRRADSATP